MTTESKPAPTAQRMARHAFEKTTPTAVATYFYLLVVLAAFFAAGVLVAAQAKALGVVAADKPVLLGNFVKHTENAAARLKVNERPNLLTNCSLAQ